MTTYEKIKQLIQSGKNLGSCSEMCAVACALDDPDKAPIPYNSLQKAWERLNAAQMEAVSQYRKENGLPPLKPTDPVYT